MWSLTFSHILCDFWGIWLISWDDTRGLKRKKNQLLWFLSKLQLVVRCWYFEVQHTDLTQLCTVHERTSSSNNRWSMLQFLLCRDVWSEPLSSRTALDQNQRAFKTSLFESKSMSVVLFNYYFLFKFWKQPCHASSRVLKLDVEIANVKIITGFVCIAPPSSSQSAVTFKKHTDCIKSANMT